MNVDKFARLIVWGSLSVITLCVMTAMIGSTIRFMFWLFV